MSINNDTVYSIANVDASGGPVRSGRARLGRPLLRAAVRRRVDEQLRLRRPSRDRDRRRELPARPARLGRRRARRRDGDPLPDGDRARSSGRWAVDGDAGPARRARAAERLEAHADRRTAAGVPLPDAGRARRTRASSSSCACWMQAFPPADRDGVYQQPLRAARPARDRVAVRRSRPRAGRGARRGARAGRAKPGGGADEAPSPTAERLGSDLPHLRLQPGLLRGRRARRRPLEAAGRPGPLHAARRRRARRAVGQPRLRGRLRDGLRRRRRRAPGRRRAATSCASPTRRRAARSGR